MNSLTMKGEAAVRPQERQRKEEKNEEWCDVAAVGSGDPYAAVKDGDEGRARATRKKKEKLV